MRTFTLDPSPILFNIESHTLSREVICADTGQVLSSEVFGPIHKRLSYDKEFVDECDGSCEIHITKAVECSSPIPPSKTWAGYYELVERAYPQQFPTEDEWNGD